MFPSSKLLSCILWFNKHIFIEKKPLIFCYFSEKGLNFVYQLFDNNWNVKSWSSIKKEFGFNIFFNFTWQKLKYSLLPFWKKIIKETVATDKLLLPNHHLIKKTLIGIEKLNSRQLYFLLVYTHPFTAASQKYFIEFYWQLWLETDLSSTTFGNPCQLFSRSFQYNILNKILYLNKNIFYVSKINFTSLANLQTFW